MLVSDVAFIQCPVTRPGPKRAITDQFPKLPHTLRCSQCSHYIRWGLTGSAFAGPVLLVGATASSIIAFNGSSFDGKLNLNSASVGGSLFLRDQAEFQEVDLAGADVAGQVEMTGSTFRGLLNMNSISIGKSLLMGDRAEFREVDLRHADIAGPVDMSGSTFRGPLNMDSISVGKSLQMRDQAEFQEVRLAGADITGQVSLNGSSFAGLLDMHSMSIGRDLHMRDGAEFREVVLGGTDIAGQVTMARSTFRGTLSMDSVFVGKSLVMGEQAEFRQVVLIAAEVSDFLDARNSSFRALELTGARIEGTLLLGSRNGTVTWASSNDGDGQPVPPRLSLRNATVGALQDGVDTWPRELQLELEGFTYDRLGGLQTGERSLPHERGSDWYIDWLSRDRFYSPQPYRQLGRILESYGHREMAADILFANRARERAESGPGEFKWWVLSALQFTIGYGYGWGYLRALCWVALFTAAGTLLIRGARNGVGDGRRPGFWYSLDMLLPVIRLNERHYDVDLSNDWRRHYFYVHKLFGYFLVSVIIAGLSGLTE